MVVVAVGDESGVVRRKQKGVVRQEIDLEAEDEEEPSKVHEAVDGSEVKVEKPIVVPKPGVVEEFVIDDDEQQGKPAVEHSS
jgi:hypothetical protein